MKVAIALFIMTVGACAAAHPHHYSAGYNHKDYYAPAHYNFGYAVKDHYYNDFGHSEDRQGDKTSGSYYVNLPNGNRQVVNYYVNGHSGYVPDVKYEPSYTAPHHYGPYYKPSYY